MVPGALGVKGLGGGGGGSVRSQETITRSEQLPSTRITAFSLTRLFLERFWREFGISLKSYLAMRSHRVSIAHASLPRKRKLSKH